MISREEARGARARRERPRCCWGQNLAAPAEFEAVKVELVPTKDNASDMLTKALDEHTFARHRDTIMNRKISES